MERLDAWMLASAVAMTALALVPLIVLASRRHRDGAPAQAPSERAKPRWTARALLGLAGSAAITLWLLTAAFSVWPASADKPLLLGSAVMLIAVFTALLISQDRARRAGRPWQRTLAVSSLMGCCAAVLIARLVVLASAA